MKAPNHLWILLMLGFILFASCSPLSKNVRQEAEPGISFEAARQNPDAYIGKSLILGGYILEVRNLPQVSEITVLQTPLDFQDRPKSKEQSQGRFVVVYEGFLDPAVYEAGRMITVAGSVQGRRTIMVDGHSYAAFSIKAVELHLWEKEQAVRPSPYYYDPFYDPFFFSPMLPPRYYRYPYYYRRPWPHR